MIRSKSFLSIVRITALAASTAIVPAGYVFAHGSGGGGHSGGGSNHSDHGMSSSKSPAFKNTIHPIIVGKSHSGNNHSSHSERHLEHKLKKLERKEKRLERKEERLRHKLEKEKEKNGPTETKPIDRGTGKPTSGSNPPITPPPAAPPPTSPPPAAPPASAPPPKTPAPGTTPGGGGGIHIDGPNPGGAANHKQD